MSKATTSIAAIFLSASLSATALDIKGVEVGARSTPEAIEGAFAVRCGEGASDWIVCEGSGTIALVYVWRLNVGLRSNTGRVERITARFHSWDFDTLETELRKKWGKGVTVDSVVQNAFGAKHAQRRITWTDKRGVVAILTRYAGSLEDGSLSVTTKEEREQREPKKGERAKDL